MIFNMIGILVGVSVFGGSLYYYIKEKSDIESRKIYGTCSVIGFIVCLFMVLKIIF